MNKGACMLDSLCKAVLSQRPVVCSLLKPVVVPSHGFGINPDILDTAYIQVGIVTQIPRLSLPCATLIHQGPEL